MGEKSEGEWATVNSRLERRCEDGGETMKLDE